MRPPPCRYLPTPGSGAICPHIHIFSKRGLVFMAAHGLVSSENNTKSPFPGSCFHLQWLSRGAHFALLTEKLGFQSPQAARCCSRRWS